MFCHQAPHCIAKWVSSGGLVAEAAGLAPRAPAAQKVEALCRLPAAAAATAAAAVTLLPTVAMLLLLPAAAVAGAVPVRPARGLNLVPEAALVAARARAVLEVLAHGGDGRALDLLVRVVRVVRVVELVPPLRLLLRSLWLLLLVRLVRLVHVPF